MSNIYTLDDLKNDLDREFAPLTIQIGDDNLVLRNLMRVNEKDRETILAALKTVEDSSGKEEDDLGVDEVTALGQAINTVLQLIVGDDKGAKLVAYVDGDLMLAMKIMELWTGATQPGEAQNSPA